MGVTVVERLIPDEGASVSFEQVIALPRARWVNCAQIFPTTEDVLNAIGSSQLDPSNEVAIESIAFSANLVCGTGQTGSAQITFYGSNRVIVSVSSRGGGWLVLGDAYYPGWRTFVNGKETPIYPADGLFRAVQLEPGEREVEFVYRPLSFTLGAPISAFAWLVCILLFIQWRNEKN
jgi:hypothetical protein